MLKFVSNITTFKSVATLHCNCLLTLGLSRSYTTISQQNHESIEQNNLASFYDGQVNGLKQEEQQIVDLLIQNLRDINKNLLNYTAGVNSYTYETGGSRYDHINSNIDNDNNLRQKINLLILNLKTFNKYSGKLEYPIRIGLKRLEDSNNQHDDNKSLLNALLGDPMSGNQDWYFKLKQRSIDQNNLVVYNDVNNTTNNFLSNNSDPQAQQNFYKITENVPTNRSLTLWKVKTPILKKDKRLSNFNNLHNLFGAAKTSSNDSADSAPRLRDLEFIELTNTKQVGNCNVNGQLNDDTDEMYEFYEDYDEEYETLNIGDGCHLYLYHTGNELLHPTKETFPHLLIVDKSATEENINSKENPIESAISKENYDTIINNQNLVVNSKLAEKANEVLMKNFGDSSTYVKLLNESNLLKLIYLLNIVTVNNKNVVELLKVINQKISRRFFSDVITDDATIDVPNNNLQFDKLKELNNIVTEDIKSWSQNANLFLQKIFNKNIDEYERKHLQWWKLIAINDDVEFYLIEMINRSLKSPHNSANFLEYFNYIEGKIDSFLTRNTVSHRQSRKEILAAQTKNNNTISHNKFLDDLSNDIINIQNKAVELLVTNLVGIELPASVVAILGGHYMYGFDLYSMCGIVALSSAIVCNNISKGWTKMINAFKKKAQENLRVEIRNREAQLSERWQHAYNEEKSRIEGNEKLLEQFRMNIKSFEKSNIE